jgi:ATP-dependent helicase/nuclease subunit A
MEISQEKILTPHQLEALNYKKHLSLTANAGSGKTFVLSKRYLEIALNEDIQLRNIAAITFTDKAASELYKKIAAEIDAKLIYTADNETRKKLERIRRQLVSANISTIHAFCIDILREFPVEAGLDANFRPIDENLSNELAELAVEETIKSAFNNSEDEKELKYLIRTFASKRIFAEQLFSLIKNRKNVFELSRKIYDKPVNEISEHLHNSFLELVKHLFLVKKERVINNLREINNTVLQLNRNNSIAIEVKFLIEKSQTINLPVDFLRFISEMKELVCTKSGKIKRQGYLPGNQQKDLLNEIIEVEEFFNDIKSIEIPANHKDIETELAKFGKVLIRFFNKSVAVYDQKKSENGYLDFEDILLHTKRILENNHVRNVLSEKYKYLMIDEYQDTNEIQYRIFLPILKNLQTGNLFVVGDEKQSIYMFRDAELEVFMETKRNIENISGSEFLLTLPDSFRMAPAICLFTNSLFQNLFNEPNELYNEVGYSEIVCARTDDAKGAVEILLGDPEEDSPHSETELVANRILNLVNEQDKKMNWGDVAVLVRKRKSFALLEKVLSKYKIPFNVVGGTGFYQRQSVYDIYNYFSFLLDIDNSAALVGILRSPFFNLSDAQIFRISLEENYRYWDKLISFGNKDKSILPVITQVKENINLAKSLEPVSLLRKILNETAYVSILAAKPNGHQEIANLEKLISLSTSFYQQGFRTVYDYVNYLKDSIEKIDEEAQAAVAEESNSVKIMTLHQAKGLEYKAVFLYKCDETIQKNPAKAKQVNVDKKTGILTKIPLNENYYLEYVSAPVVNIYNHISSRKELAESKRLFYVGATRAMDYLFISAGLKDKFNYSSDSFMGMLKKGLSSFHDFSGENDRIIINSPLKFLRKTVGEFKGEEKDLTLEIPLIKQINEFIPVREAGADTLMPSKIRITELKDVPEGEIISASKVAAFHQCPLKYGLIYEYGFSKLMNNFREWRTDRFTKKFEFNPSEEKQVKQDAEEELFRAYNLSDVKGRIIHKLLQKEIRPEFLYNSVIKYLNDELDIFEKENIPPESLAEEIKK